jgi:hypothetical protein
MENEIFVGVAWFAGLLDVALLLGFLLVYSPSCLLSPSRLHLLPVLEESLVHIAYYSPAAFNLLPLLHLPFYPLF